MPEPKKLESIEDVMAAFEQARREGPMVTMAKRRKAKYIKLHPLDTGDCLEDAFFEDPRTFVPHKNTRGEVLRWGLVPYGEQGLPVVDALQFHGRVMATQNMYRSWEGGYPENQFVNVLVEKKKKQLSTLDLGRLKHRDYILRITMPFLPLHYERGEDFLKKIQNGEVGIQMQGKGEGGGGDSLVERRFKVSGGINLDTLQDKVIQPIMGWKRNFHAFVYTDLSDGALFGPKDPTTVDSYHKNGTGYEYLLAQEYTLAHLAQKKGTRFVYLYDFGDNWWHYVDVEDILPEEESNGAVEVLSGRGICPPENGDGNWSWAESIYTYKYGSPSSQTEIMKKLFHAPNYHHQQLRRFDPLEFEVAQAEKSVKTCLESKASLRSGGRVYNMPMPMHPIMGMGADHDMGLGATGLGGAGSGMGIGGMGGGGGVYGNPMFGDTLKKGQKVKRDIYEGDESGEGAWKNGYFEEIVSTKRDGVSRAVCAGCGSPHGLKACSRCRGIWYCGEGHQKAHWPTHKSDCKPAKSSKGK